MITETASAGLLAYCWWCNDRTADHLVADGGQDTQKVHRRGFLAAAGTFALGGCSQMPGGTDIIRGDQPHPVAQSYIEAAAEAETTEVEGLNNTVHYVRPIAGVAGNQAYLLRASYSEEYRALNARAFYAPNSALPIFTAKTALEEPLNDSHPWLDKIDHVAFLILDWETEPIARVGIDLENGGRSHVGISELELPDAHWNGDVEMSDLRPEHWRADNPRLRSDWTAPKLMSGNTEGVADV